MNCFQELEDVFEQYWQNEGNYVVMPNTIRARTYLSVITKDINVNLILDNDETMDNTYFCEILIKYAPEYLKQNKKKKILVSSHYVEIAEQLKNAEYKEYIDFIDMHSFVSMWYWKKRRDIHLLDIHTAITTYCSLNCKNCNMFINHYKAEQKRTVNFDEFKENFELLFKVVDYCYKVSILGGEPLLNKELPMMLEWLFQKYHEKIGEIVIVTNGTILPNSDLLNVLQQINAKISISDYTSGIKYVEKIESLEHLLTQKSILFERNKEMKWKDFYFPKKKQEVKFMSVRDHMLCCNPVFRGLNDKKFYYCHIVWSAVEAGLLKENDSDYVDLESIHKCNDREKLLKHDLGYVDNGYVSMCALCGGCGYDNQSVISAGIQE